MTPPASAAEFHRLSLYHRQGMSGSGLDWSNRPALYKEYPGAESLPLPRDLVLPRAAVWDCLTGRHRPGPQPLSLGVLARLLFMSYGITEQVDHGDQTFVYRSAPSAGALYPIELYVACPESGDLPAGLYHYDLSHFALTRLRSGPPPASIGAPAVILTARWFKSAWKYRDRAFRYCLLDAGHVAENVVLAAETLGLRPEFSAEFDDPFLADYLGLETDREGVLAVVRLSPREGTPASAANDRPTEKVPSSSPLARDEKILPAIVAAAGLTSGLLARPLDRGIAWPAETEISLSVAEDGPAGGLTLVQALQKRRSRRNFRPEAVARPDLSRLLEMVVSPEAGLTMNLSLATNEVRDLPDGCYHVRGQNTIARHKGGFLGPHLAMAALSQDWVGRANLIFMISAPVEKMESAAGPRSYRLAGLSAGRIGQRLYLAAETLGWGCCGVGAFFDQEVADILSLPAGEYPLYLVPVGPVKKRTHGGRGDEI